MLFSFPKCPDISLASPAKSSPDANTLSARHGEKSWFQSAPVMPIRMHCSFTSIVSFCRKPVRIMAFQSLSDVSVYRKCFKMMKCKQADTVRHFLPDAIQFHQFSLCFFIRHLFYCLQRDFSLCQAFCSPHHILAPVPQVAVLQSILMKFRQCLRLRKCIVKILSLSIQYLIHPIQHRLIINLFIIRHVQFNQTPQLKLIITFI